MSKNWEEIKIPYSEGMEMEYLLKVACKKFGSKESYKIAKLFNKSGIQFFHDDIQLLGPGDIIYLSLKGKWSWE